MYIENLIDEFKFYKFIIIKFDDVRKNIYDKHED